MSIGAVILFLFVLCLSILSFFLALAALGVNEKMKEIIASNMKTTAMMVDMLEARIRTLENRGKIVPIRGNEYE